MKHPNLRRVVHLTLLLAYVVLLGAITPLQTGLQAATAAPGADHMLYLPILANPIVYLFLTERVSVATDGTEGNGASHYPSISNDGRFVTFTSYASNLVSDDTNSHSDIFVHDRFTRETTRVSVASDGTQANDLARYPSISGDGRFVAFQSPASSLVTNDTNGVDDIFIHDRQTGQTTRVPVASDGTQANWGSELPAISGDGRFVTFQSDASNLVADDNNGWGDIFVHDQLTGETTRVSVASDGTQANVTCMFPSISGDGRYVAFVSQATSLVSNDTNLEYDVFVHDRHTGQTTRVSVATDGAQGYGRSALPSLSGDGRYVTFASSASNLVSDDTNSHSDIFVHDRLTGETTRVSVASDGTQGDSSSAAAKPSISADGRFVTFSSYASNLVSDDTNSHSDIFVHDRLTGETTRVSVASDGAQGNRDTGAQAISGDGLYVVFGSNATNLVSGDNNRYSDIFFHDRDG